MTRSVTINGRAFSMSDGRSRTELGALLRFIVTNCEDAADHLICSDKGHAHFVAVSLCKCPSGAVGAIHKSSTLFGGAKREWDRVVCPISKALGIVILIS